MKDSGEFKPIETKRLLLNQFNYIDAVSFLKIAGTFEIAKYLRDVYTTTLDEAYEKIACYKKENGNGDFYIAIRVRDKSSVERNLLIGGIIATKLRKITRENVLKIEFFLGEQFRGNGYIKEALETFLKMIKKLKYDGAFFEITDDNTFSKKLAMQLGAKIQFSKTNCKFNKITNYYFLDLNQM